MTYALSSLTTDGLEEPRISPWSCVSDLWTATLKGPHQGKKVSKEFSAQLNSAFLYPQPSPSLSLPPTGHQVV